MISTTENTEGTESHFDHPHFKTVFQALRDTISKHLPITKNLVGSAAKRMIGQMSGRHTRLRVFCEASRLATQ